MNVLRAQQIKRQPFEVMLDQGRIANRVAELGKEISTDYEGRDPVLVGVLKGCMVFLADLVRHMHLQLDIEFVSAASYRAGMQPEDEVVLGGGMAISLRGRDVLIVEGIIDSGRTIRRVLERIQRDEPASLEIVTLLDKPGSHRSKLSTKYKGFSIGNEFVIGYGLDNTQKYRNLPFIGKMIDP